MFISSNSEIYPGLFLLKLGDSCHYVAQGAGISWLFDPGTPLHVQHLETRMQSLGQIFGGRMRCLLTHLHAERMGGLVALKSRYPACELFSSGPMKEHTDEPTFLAQVVSDLAALHKMHASPQWEVSSAAQLKAALEPSHLLVDSDLVELSDALTLRVIACPLHTDHSLLYYLEPARFLIVDEGFGYFRGKEMSSPGADANLKMVSEFIEKIIELDVAAICFPFFGVISGEFVSRYLKSMNEAVSQLYSEVAKARQDTLPTLEIKQAIKEQFYTLETRDPFLQFSLERTYKALWEQLR